VLGTDQDDRRPARMLAGVECPAAITPAGKLRPQNEQKPLLSPPRFLETLSSTRIVSLRPRAAELGATQHYAGKAVATHRRKRSLKTHVTDVADSLTCRSAS
jgi:hypothetical protein